MTKRSSKGEKTRTGTSRPDTTVFRATSSPSPKTVAKTGNVQGSAAKFTNPQPKTQSTIPQPQPRPVTKEDVSSGKSVLESIVKKQRDKVVSVLERITTHNIDTMTEGMEVSSEEYAKLHDEFLSSLNDKMMNDIAEFRWVVDKYVQDLRDSKVSAPKNILTQRELEELGAIGVKGDILKSAGSRVSSSLRRAGPFTKEELGLEDPLLSAKATRKDGPLGKALEKINSLTRLFQEKETDGKTEEKTYELDKSKFKKDEEYRKKMLKYVEELLKGNKELTKKQEALVKKVKSEEDRLQFIKGTRERLSLGQQVVYDIGAKLGTGLFNLGSNLFGGKKKPADVVEEQPTAKEDVKTEEPSVIRSGRREEPVEEVKERVTWKFADKDVVEENPVVFRSGRTNQDESDIEARYVEDEQDDAREEEILLNLEKIEKNTEGLVEAIKNVKVESQTSSLDTPDRFKSILKKVGSFALSPAGLAVGAGVGAVAATGAAAYMINKGNTEYAERMGAQSEEYKIDYTKEDKRPLAVQEQMRKSAETQAAWMKMSPEERKAASKSPEANYEPLKKEKIEKVVALTEAALSAKEEKRDAKMAAQTQQIISAPSNTTVLGGSAKQHIKQNPRNPDNSFVAWLKTRVGYV